MTAWFRYKLLVQYVGGRLNGWQRQDPLNGLGVSDVLQQAIESMVPYGHASYIYGSGRTDAGVHALGQACHVDILRYDQTKEVAKTEKKEKENKPKERMPFSGLALMNGINFHLRGNGQQDSVQVIDCHPITQEFHARHSAMRRTYTYLLAYPRSNSRLFPIPPLIWQGRVYCVPYRLDLAAMQEATDFFLGTHSFAGFRTDRCSRDPVRTIEKVRLLERTDTELFANSNFEPWILLSFQCTGKSFVMHQIRSMIGALVEVGKGKSSSEHVKNCLLSGEKFRCDVAPPYGLYLTHVEYPSQFVDSEDNPFDRTKTPGVALGWHDPDTHPRDTVVSLLLVETQTMRSIWLQHCHRDCSITSVGGKLEDEVDSDGFSTVVTNHYGVSAET
eukprot:g9541.t1